MNGSWARWGHMVLSEEKLLVVVIGLLCVLAGMGLLVGYLVRQVRRVARQIAAYEVERAEEESRQTETE